MTTIAFDTADLPADHAAGLFLGRIATTEGPSPILVRHGIAYDMAPIAPTTVDLVEARAFDETAGRAIGPVAGMALLSPIDLQCVKAAGVTFAVSALERVIEERARGDAGAAAALRAKLEARVGAGIRAVVPGSDAAATLKAALIEEGLWSQYLEVAIGPDAEVFTKAPLLSSVGWGAPIGVRSDSVWNNPEPEVVLLADARGRAVGATLGNDVNLRDFEGRSALLLGKAKDNRASCAIGPLVRLFDDGFTMDDVRTAHVELTIVGDDGYRLTGHSSMAEISRDPEDLLRQVMSEHDYPDGFVLFCGTLFAPVEDRGAPGRGFTHRHGDLVTIESARLGRLVNRVCSSAEAPLWTMGVTALMRNLARRGLLAAERHSKET